MTRALASLTGGGRLRVRCFQSAPLLRGRPGGEVVPNTLGGDETLARSAVSPVSELMASPPWPSPSPCQSNDPLISRSPVAHHGDREGGSSKWNTRVRNLNAI